MRLNKVFAGFAAAAIAALTAVSACAEDYEIPFNTKFGGGTVNTYTGIVLGEDNGQWLAGGDNGDTGVTIDMLKEYAYVEIAYTCDNPIEGVLIGPAFKVHIKDKLDDAGKDVFYDYLPATWVGYGPQGTEGKGFTVNSLETIQQQPLEAEGVIKVSVTKLLGIFEPDSDYLMGIGVGANNGLCDDEFEDEEYVLTAMSVKLTGTAGEDAAEAVETEAPATEAETTPAETEAPATETETTPSETTAAETTPAETTIAETTAAETTVAETTSEPAPKDNTVMIVVIIVVAVVVIGGVAAFVIVKKKK